MGKKYISAGGKEITIRGILATDWTYQLGYDGQLIFNNPDDLDNFKTTTMGKVIVMGWDTFKSMNYRILPGRLTAIMTHNPTVEKQTILANAVLPDNTPMPCLVTNMNECLDLVDKTNRDSIYVIGGAKIFDALRKYITSWYITTYRVNLLERGVELGLLPEGYDPDKLTTMSGRCFTGADQSFSVRSGEFITPSGIPIRYRTEVRYRWSKFSTETVIEEELADNRMKHYIYRNYSK